MPVINSLDTPPADPFLLFDAWFAEASSSETLDPNAMTVATATPDGRPAARILLLKGRDDRGFTFYTNTQSRKGGDGGSGDSLRRRGGDQSQRQSRPCRFR